MEVENFLAKASALAIKKGAFKAEVIKTDEIPFDLQLRKYCQMNTCGAYGKNWMCPPAVGEIEALIQSLKKYQYALVFQTVGQLEDSFDINGMEAQKKKHIRLSRKLLRDFRRAGCEVFLLCAGGCTLCSSCAKTKNQPCRHPEEAVSSLEAYGIDVTKLAKVSGMNYINGMNTVTYFSALFIV